jgi:hypothetical protein
MHGSRGTQRGAGGARNGGFPDLRRTVGAPTCIR